MKPEVVLYRTAGCGLCDRARALVLGMATQLPLDLREVDIASDPKLLSQYLWSVPVVFVAGALVCSGTVRPEEIRRALRRCMEQGEASTGD